jgi:hypothetical protein
MFLGLGQTFNSDLLLDRNVSVGMDWGLPTFWYIGWNTGRNFQAFDDLDTRGGPQIVKPSSTYFSLFLNSDSRKTWRFGSNFNVTRAAVDGGSNRVGAFLTLQPSTRLQASISGNYNFGITAAQWIDNVDVTGDGADDHIYGTLHRDVVDITARATYAFSRDLTLQVFLQPFVAVGAYENIRMLARPPGRSTSRRRRSKTIRTSTPSRCAATPCCAGNTVRAARSSSSGTAPAATPRVPACFHRGRISAAPSAPTATTSS